MARTIQSPGVEIREVDLTLRPVVNQGTSVFIAGFSNQGPIDQILEPTSISDFEQVYGVPTNAAERYFYHTVRSALQAPIQLKVTRLPYGFAKGEGFDAWKYSALVYPVVGVDNTGDNTVASPLSSTISPNGGLSGCDAYFFGTPTHIELSLEQYQEILNNNITWTNNPSVTSRSDANGGKFSYDTLGNAGIIILNRAQVTNNNKFEGYYIGLTDNNNNNPATPFDGILNVNAIASSSTVNSYVDVPPARLNFTLSASKFGDGSSMSEVMENVSNYDLSQRSFDDTLSLGLFKLRQSTFSPNVIALDYVLSESSYGSLDFHRQINDPNGGIAVPLFLGARAATSPNVRILVNPFVSNQYANSWLGNDGVPSKKARMLSPNLAAPFNYPGSVDTLQTYNTRVGATSGAVSTLLNRAGTTNAAYSLGIYTNTVVENKNIGNLPAKLDRAYELVENPDLFPINLACEAGLGTIYVNVAETAINSGVGLSACGPFDDTTPLNGLSAFYVTNNEQLNDVGTRIRGNYNAIASIMVNQAQNQRKDFLVILDPIRNIFVQGANNKVINTKKLFSPNAGIDPNPYADGFVNTNFSQHIYWPLRHQFGLLDTSYACTYATVPQVLDPVSNRQVWVPFSGFAAAAMGNTDANFQPWFAPAGFTRGILLGVNDLGIYPKLKQRDQLYKIGQNPVAYFPVEGFVIFGQKTMLKRPSAFDRINVRRLFLNLEIATRDTIKYFIFEPNTLFTRTQVVNTITPIFENAKNTEGVYDYLIICDERNNTPDVIDQNEMKVDIYLKPVRAAEFILVSFYATRTGQNFQELLA